MRCELMSPRLDIYYFEGFLVVSSLNINLGLCGATKWHETNRFIAMIMVMVMIMVGMWLWLG